LVADGDVELVRLSTLRKGALLGAPGLATTESCPLTMLLALLHGEDRRLTWLSSWSWHALVAVSNECSRARSAAAGLFLLASDGDDHGDKASR
jgi:hypothetical protein